jgi:hypothetical protein
MPTTAELRVMSGCQFAHAIVINGIEQVFVDHADLVDYNFGGSRQGVLGLTREGLTWRHACDFRKGLLSDNQWSFTITDFDGSLARLFAAVDESERPLNDVPLGSGHPIYPNDSLAARTDLFDKHIGTERIGPAGERGLYPSPIGTTFAPKHSISVEGLDLAAAPVSDNPIVWAGRRVVLYRIYRDHATYPLTSGQATWRPIDEAVRLNWGTLRDAGSVRGREWTLEADGPESWLRKPLGVGFQPTSVRAVPDPPTLAEEETGIGVGLATKGGVDGTTTVYGGRGFAVSITATTVDEIRDEIIAEIEAAAAAATDYLGDVSLVWEDQTGFHVAMETNGSVRIGVSETLDDDGGIMTLVLHKKVWSLLGYDIELQNSLDREPDEPKSIEFSEVGESGSFASLVPGPGYYRGIFRTGRVEWEDSGGSDNAGVTREYVPQYLGGTSVLLHDPPPGGQVVRLAGAALGLGATGSTVAHPGQYDRPVASLPGDAESPAEINGVPCDRQGLWLFHGKRRFANSEDTFDEFQVVRASWAAALISQDGLVSGDTITVTEILTPRKFGFDRPPLQSDWVVLESAAEDDDGGLNAMPLVNLGWNESSEYDLAHIIVQRLMYGTGTADGWNSYASDTEATQDSGDNEPAGDHTVVRDAEISELGLAIPADMIHTPDAWGAEAAKVENDDILKVKLVVTPGYQAVDAIQSMLRPVGWCMHLRNGRYGIWCPADPVTQADAEVVLTRAEKAATWGRLQITPQDVRKWQPVDKWTYNYDYNPKNKKTNKSLEIIAPDAGLRYRPGEVAETVNAHGMRGTANGTGERVAHLSKWWSRRHFEIRGWPVHGVDPGEDCWVGTIVRITDATLVDVLGEYGVSGRLGVITGVTHTLGTDQVTCLLDILVFADRAALPRHHAISAQAFGYDSSTRTLYCEDNWLRLETDSTDAPRFSEPSYTGIAQFGGAANVICYQWDGSTWSAGLTGTVSSTTSNTIVLANGSTSGTYYRDMDTIVVLRPPTNQDAGEWPLQLYSPICDANGQFVPPGGGVQDGYPWEP